MANKWWKSTRALVQLKLGEAVPISWEYFKRIFLDHFFPRTLQESRARQFMDLTQGSMTVAQYATTFMELSRFASYLIPDEEKKAEKFECGLSPTIAEEDLQENIEYNSQRKRQQQQQLQAVSHKDKRPHIENRQGQPPAGQAYPTCATCGRRHLGKCMYGQNVCFKCGKPNHLARDCPIKKLREPSRNGGEKTQAIARVYTLTPVDAEASNDVVTGKLSLFSRHASILFDSGATHSFISNHYAPLAEKIPEPLEPSMYVATPSGDHIICDSMLIGCPIKIQGRILPADLIIFNMSEFDVILGMDWLFWNHASVDCFNKRVVFKSTDGEEFSFQSVRETSPPRVISALQAT
ncbi:hypothetical protein F2P56_024559 [Juglans regia]|uniref:CCHC-type domain-containing protein n=2 Tax=Juglans regia TaxID=51240 RepID=A0A833X9E5_JUGRE|nr:uncharacterized protein LOC108982153 [Juglans regia]KAF5454930.1 hypothetical protein F2P56_024559 [Juglans regia]